MTLDMFFMSKRRRPPPFDPLSKGTVLSLRLGCRPLHMILGNYETSGAPLSIDPHTRRLHIAAVGQTGTGKSTLLKNMMLHDFAAGRGFALIDPHGDLAKEIADAVPPHRIQDTIYLDPLDPTHAVGLNPLCIDAHPAIITAYTVSAFKHVWKDSWGPRLEHILGNAVRVILSTNSASLVELPLFLARKDYRDRLLRKIDDPFVRLYWKVQFASYTERMRAEALAPLDNKIGQFSTNPYLRAIVSQRSTFTLPDVINNNRILIANLSKRMGDDPSHLLGAFLVTSFAQAAQSRASIPENERKDFTLYVDEFQNFATESFAAILSEMRKWRLNLVVANQFTKQVPEPIRDAIFGNVATLVVFRVGALDAPILADQLDFPNPRYLTGTENYTAWIKTVRDGNPTSPQLVRTSPPRPAPERSLQAVISRTHARYARERLDIERRIDALFTDTPRPKNIPRWP